LNTCVGNTALSFNLFPWLRAPSATFFEATDQLLR
jgi:hypothetical protein